MVSWLLCGCGEDEPRVGVGAGDAVVVLPEAADPSTLEVARELGVYLARLLGSVPATESLPRGAGPRSVEALARRTQAGVVVVLDPEALGYDDLLAGEEAPDAFSLVAFEQGEYPSRLDESAGGVVALLGARTALGRRYAVYELLRRLGARFYHPEAEYLPHVPPSQVRARLTSPTALARRGSNGGADPRYVPDFAERAYTFHGSHPLEHLESFSDSAYPIDEARNVNLWIVKNRGNRFRGAGRGIAPAARATERREQLEELRRRLGMPSTAGITLHNQQQGANAALDPNSPVAPKQQIEDYVDAQLRGADDDLGEFGIHFGPTEVTVTPDQETLDAINWAGRRVKAQRPDLPVMINNHTTGSQASPHFTDLGCPNATSDPPRADYYDLSFHSDANLGVRVHTVMFYPLEGPAHVYNQQTFAHKLCLMQQASAAGRALSYFPEGSWWLSFDNPIPVYLPLYIWSRRRDLDLVEPLLVKHGGSLAGHRMFNSGHEWGYWQQDYAVGLMHWKSDVSLEQILDEITDPFCRPEQWPKSCAARDEAKAVLTEMMDFQSQTLLTKPRFGGKPGGLYTYLAGEEPADEIAAATGFEFRPVRTSFSSMLSWSAKTLSDFRFSDQKALIEMDDEYTGWAERLREVRDQVPQDGLEWFDEILDGTEIDRERVRQAEALYDAVAAFREDTLKREADPSAPDPKLRASEKLERAADALTAARAIIERREEHYRYPAAQMFGGGLDAESGVANGTTYPYRVHTKTHLLTFWTNRDAAAREIIEGKSVSTNELVLHPVLAAPKTPLTLVWPALSGLSGSIDLGDGTMVDPSVTVHDYAGVGVFRVSGTLSLGDQPLPIEGYVVRSDTVARSQQGGFELTQPDSPLAKSLLGSLVPRLWLARVGSSLAIVPETRPDGKLDFRRVVIAKRGAGAGFQTEPMSFLLPIVAPGGTAVAADVHVQKFVVRTTEDLAASAALAGELVLADVVQALIALAGYDEKGALATLAGVLGFDPASPPETVAFEATVALEAGQ
ncbi:MAG: hypothetical protein R3B13_28260 [Polyangiaceae bacterium]